MRTNFFSLLAFVLFLGSCNNKQNNWNQYLGPNRNAKSIETGIFRSWPENGPTKLWEVPLGSGYGGASIFNDEVFVLDREVGKTDILRCLDLNTGAEKWNYKYAAEGELPFPGSRAVPTVDEQFVWSVGPHGHMFCIDKKTHQPIWSHNILSEYDGELPNWGISQSPVIYNDLVIVAPQGEKAGIVAYNKFSGDLVWQTRRLSGYHFYVSPTLANFGGVDQIIMISSCVKGDGFSTDEVVAFEANSGKELWRYEGLNSFASISPALVVNNKQLFLTECAYNDNYDPISILLEITKEEEEFSIKELFKNEEVGCKMHPAVVFGEHFYLNNNGRPNEMVCLNSEGENLWKKGSAPNFEMGSLILIDGLIINQNGKNGDIHLIEPSPAGYKELGKASFFTSDKSQAWSPLAFSQGKLLARDMEKMVCVDLKN